jgi:type 1 fimbria pilin
MIMNFLSKIAIAAAVPAALLAAPASAQVVADSDSFVVNLSGSVESQCELLPNGSTDFDVDMLEFGNQGLLVIGYSCNSPYSISLQSANGGMLNTSSGVAGLTIPYGIEALTTGGTVVNIQSDAITSPQEVINEGSWLNIFANGGLAAGTMDLNFLGILDEYAVAGEYEDTLTIVLAADL